MTDSAPIQPDGNQYSSGNASAKSQDTGYRRYAILGGVGLVAAAVISLAAVLLLRPGEPRSQPDHRAVTAEPTGSPPDRSPPQPTVRLAASPVPATAEQLQQEAREVAETLRSRFPEMPEALHVVAMLAAQLRQSNQAEELWKKCIALSPQREAYYVNLAAIAMDRGNSELAAQTLQQALDAGCASSAVRHHLAIALSNLGRCAEAEGMIQKALADEPQSPGYWLVLGEAQLKLGKAAEAETSLRKAIDLGVQSPAAYFALGNACARQGKNEEAAKFREQFAKLKASQPLDPQQRYQVLSTAEARRAAVTTLCEAATVHSWQKDFLEAERLLLRAIALDPAHADSCRALAALYRAAKMPAEERVVWQRLVEIEPHNFSNYLRLAKVCDQLGDAASAEATLKLATAIWPAAADPYAMLAQFYLQGGKAPQARWYAQEAVRREPSAEGYRFVASTCRLLGDTAAAEAALAKARKLESNRPKPPPASPQRP